MTQIPTIDLWPGVSNGLQPAARPMNGGEPTLYHSGLPFHNGENGTSSGVQTLL